MRRVRILHDIPEDLAQKHSIGLGAYLSINIGKIQHIFRLTMQREEEYICCNCNKVLDDVPLILFVDEGKKGALEICFKCGEKIGLLNLIIHKQQISYNYYNLQDLRS